VVKNRAAYQRGYNKVWKAARRNRLIEMLGGNCVRCGTAENLEFDHIDPSTKDFPISTSLSRAWDDLVEEAAKCQLLCKPCHVAKGAEDRPELQHGTFYVYQYWNCRCDPCKAANARRSAAIRARTRPSSNTSTPHPTANDGGSGSRHPNRSSRSPKLTPPPTGSSPPSHLPDSAMVPTDAERRRGYNKAWRQARRARLVEMLGGCCVRCGATEDLEFDHIDPSTKVFAVCAGLSKAWGVLVEEAAKCQLLCKPCHVAKGAEDRPELAHGTYYVYWYWNCRCDLCKAANAAKSAALLAKKQQRMAGPSLPLLLMTFWTMVLASSGGRIRTYDNSVNSRVLCQLSYAGSVFSGFSVTAGHLEPYVTALICNFSLRRRSGRRTAG
jgi:5-methylcytosine-specific restriction endonuclease McrA